MKGLAIDSAVSRLTIAAKNDDKVFISVYDIGMKQSETIVPAIDLALSKAGLEKTELEYLALTSGPGSFTGLRLAISALKALELALGIPLYGISSLEAYSYAYSDLNMPVIAGIDANKDKFYASIRQGTKVLLEDGDYEVETLCKEAGKYKELFICGPDANKLKQFIAEKNPALTVSSLKFEPNAVESIFAITEEKIAKGEKPMQDYDGPVYLRASEAELKLNEK